MTGSCTPMPVVLGSRASFLSWLDYALDSARPGGERGAILLLDLDRFREVVGSFGHVHGDLLLDLVAERLSGLLPATAALGRIDGDEFGIMLRGAGLDEAEGVARRIVDLGLQPVELRGQEHWLSISVGVVLYPADGGSAEELLRNAELALHRAKEAGRSTWQVFSWNMRDQIRRRVAIEDWLRHALVGNELSLHYQPRVDLAGDRICGWEALLRWPRGAEQGIGPGEFVPVAEQSGLIVPLGDWVLREACSQLAKWRAAGLEPGTMAVNLSPRQFASGALAERTAGLLREYGLDAAWLEFEVTESAIMDDVAASEKLLHELKALGVSLAVDDFGTGYSSLAYLKRLPIDKLKIDQAFIRHMTVDENDAAIVRTIIALGHTLGLRVVAEGVETASQAMWLRKHRCEEMQGFHFGHALPAGECEALMRKDPRLVPPAAPVAVLRPAPSEAVLPLCGAFAC